MRGVQVTTRIIKPAADIRLENAEPSARTIASISALQPFISAACVEYTVHSTYLNRVMAHVAKHGLSRKAQPPDQIKRDLGQVPRCCPSIMCML